MELKITCTQVEVKALKLPENEIKDYLAADIIERDMTWGEPQYQELYFTDIRKITVEDDGETIYEGNFKDFETGDISEDEFDEYSYLEIGKCKDCELVYDIDDWDPDNMTFDEWVLKLPEDDAMVYDPRYDYCTADEVFWVVRITNLTPCRAESASADSCSAWASSCVRSPALSITRGSSSAAAAVGINKAEISSMARNKRMIRFMSPPPYRTYNRYRMSQAIPELTEA